MDGSGVRRVPETHDLPKGVILRDTPTFLRHMAEWLEVLALESASRSKPGYGHLSAMNLGGKAQSPRLSDGDTKGPTLQ